MKIILKKLGYQATFDFEDAFEAIEFGIEKGFQCVELNLICSKFLPEKYSPTQRQQLRNYEFPILIHAPEGLALFCTHRKVLDSIIERFYEIIDFGKDLNAKAITTHLGIDFTLSFDNKMTYLHDIVPQEYQENLRYALTKLAEYSKNKVPVCLENTSSFRYEIFKEILIEMLTNQNLWLTWDIGHTNRIKNKAQEEKFYLKLQNKIKNVHLHDNHGGWDEHNIPGTGTVDFKHSFELLKGTDTYYIIEVRPKYRAVISLENIKKILSS